MKKRTWGKKQPPALRTIFRRRDLIAKADPIVGKSTGALEWYSRLSFKELKEQAPFLAEQLKKIGVNPHLHTTKQLNKMTKKGLIRLVIKLEKFIVSAVYQMYKSKLPRLRTRAKTETMAIGSEYVPPYRKIVKRKSKRKFSRKQLAAQRLFAKRARAGTLRRR